MRDELQSIKVFCAICMYVNFMWKQFFLMDIVVIWYVMVYLCSCWTSFKSWLLCAAQCIHHMSHNWQANDVHRIENQYNSYWETITKVLILLASYTPRLWMATILDNSLNSKKFGRDILEKLQLHSIMGVDFYSTHKRFCAVLLHWNWNHK